MAIVLTAAVAVIGVESVTEEEGTGWYQILNFGHVVQSFRRFALVVSTAAAVVKAMDRVPQFVQPLRSQYEEILGVSRYFLLGLTLLFELFVDADGEHDVAAERAHRQRCGGATFGRETRQLRLAERPQSLLVALIFSHHVHLVLQRLQRR